MNIAKAYARFHSLSDLSKALILSVVLGSTAMLSFKLPFMPVAWIVQNQVALLIGYLFGPRVGFLSALFFLIEGALGAPVFSLGRSGLGIILGPSGGYLMAYPVAAFVAGILKQKGSKTFISTFTTLSFANLVIYALGVSQLSYFVGFKSAIMLGVVPFIATDAIKTCIATFALKMTKN